MDIPQVLGNSAPLGRRMHDQYLPWERKYPHLQSASRSQKVGHLRTPSQHGPLLPVSFSAQFVPWKLTTYSVWLIYFKS